jgi:two-component system phosphate regulon sensor histidine kinase PhoR
LPFHSSIFRKLILSALVLIGATLGALDFYLTGYTAARERNAVEQRLAAEGRILREQLAAVKPDGLHAWAHAAGAAAKARVTLIDPQGAVLGDSEHDAGTMENHAGRPEIEAARAGRVGFSLRHSATLGEDLSYAALPASYGGRPGYVLRLAVPLTELHTAIADVRSRILLASVIAAVAALAMALLLSRPFTRRVRRLQDFAEHMRADKHADTLPRDTDDELGQLGGALSQTSLRLHELFEKLSLESGRREAILSSMVEGVLAVDHELRVTFCNEAFARTVGARMPVPERLPVVELVRDPQFLDMLSRVLVTASVLKQRIQLSAADGRTFEVQSAPLGFGARRGAIAILHDITDLERLERVRKDFVANVSHELRTPLTAIRGYAETLLDGALEDEENNRKFLEIIRAHAIRLNNITTDLLVLSELESGGAPGPEPELVSIRAALESALRTVESEARVRNVALKTGRVDDSCVLGHRIRLEQAFVNLIDNAVKFNREGGEVVVEAGLTSDRKTTKITISDTGIGIPSEDLPRVFERFYRVDKARSRQVGGTGLGLSIVKHVIERAGGTISVESRLGKGSTFTIVLPAC